MNLPTRGRARPTSGGPRVPFPPLEAYEPRQPGSGVCPARIVGVPAPRTATPAATAALRDAPPPTTGHVQVPQAQAGIAPILVDPSYGHSSSGNTPSMTSVAGALEGMHLGDAPSLAMEATTQMFNMPPLLSSNLIAIARTAFTHDQAQRFAVSTAQTFDTDLTVAEMTERLALLMSMRHDVASQVREIILLGQARQEPPAVILNELLDLTELYMRDPDRATPF